MEVERSRISIVALSLHFGLNRNDIVGSILSDILLVLAE